MAPIPYGSHLETADPTPAGSTATDGSGRLSLTLDADGRVSAVAITTLAPDDVLRETGPLTTALQEAWDRARFYQQAALPVSEDEAVRLTRLGEDLLAGRFRVEPPPAPPAPSEVAPSLETLAARAKLRREAGTPTVTAADVIVPPVPEVVRDGGLRIELATGGRPRTLVVEPDWIARASAATLSATLSRALGGTRREDAR